MTKHAVDECDRNNWRDPFLFKGSIVDSGSSWMLLCRLDSSDGCRPIKGF